MTTHTAVKTCVWGERVRTLAPIVAQWRDAGEQERHIPRPLFEALRDADIFRISAPTAVGGAAVEEETVLQVSEELARQDGSVGWNVMIASNAASATCMSLPSTLPLRRRTSRWWASTSSVSACRRDGEAPRHRMRAQARRV